MTELFDKHMYEYKPIFYHYLDGYIKEDGYNGAYEFLKTHGSKFIGEENITIGKSGKYSKANGFYIELYNFITKEEHLISLNSDQPMFSTNGIKKELIPELKQLFSYAIIQIGDEDHDMSLCFRIIDKKLICYIFNSGKGIEINQNIEVLNNGLTQKYYQPAKCKELCSDITNESEFTQGIKTALSLCFFNHLYLNMIHLKSQSYNIDDKQVEFVVDTNILNLITFINTNGCDDLIIDKKNYLTISLLYSNVNQKTLYYNEASIYKLYTESDNTPIEKKMEFNTIKNTINTQFTATMYYILCDKISQNLPPTLINEIFKNKSNDNIISKFKTYQELSKISSTVIKKTTLYFTDKPYIIDQQSGSCTWFSFYWPILLYFVYKNNYLEYSEFIIKINKYFEECLRTTIMTSDNITNSMNGNTFHLIKKTYCKLVDIGLGNYEFIEDINDCLFNTFDVNKSFPDGRQDKNYIFPNYSTIYDISNINTNFIAGINKKLYNTPHGNYSNILFNGIIDLIILQNDNNVNCIEYANTQFLFYYIVYKFFKTNRITCFREINIAETFCSGSYGYSPTFCYRIRALISNIRSNYVDYNNLKSHLKNSIIDPVITDIYKHLEQYNSSFDKNKLCYVYKYYHIANIFYSGNEDIEKFSNFINNCVTFTKIVQLLNQMAHGINYQAKQMTYENTNELMINIFANIEILINAMVGPRGFGTKYNSVISTINDIEEYIRNNFNRKHIMIRDTNYLYKYSENLINTNGVIQINFKSIDDFNKLKKYLFLNPVFIYTDFNSSALEISDDSFVRCHIFEISQEANVEYKKSLIRFFAEQFWLKKTNNDKELKNILINLHLLVFNADCVDDYYINQIKNKINVLNNDIHNIINDRYTDRNGQTYEAVESFDIESESSYNSLFAFNVITNSLLEFKNNLLKYANSQTMFDFCTDISQNYETLFKSPTDKLLDKIKDVYPSLQKDDSYKYGLKFSIDNKSYILARVDKNPGFLSIVNFFKTSYKNPYFFIEDKDDKDIEFFIIVDDPQQVVVKILGTFIDEFKFKITKIYVNNYEVIKFADIKLPFKYVIPLTCNNLIFKTDNIYNVIFFKNKNYNEDTNLIGFNNCKEGVEIFKINEQTMLYPKIDTLGNFGLLCENYHVRPLNIIFTKKSQDSKRPNGYCVNDYLYKLFKFTGKHEFLKTKLKQRPYNKFELLNKTIDVNLANLTFAKKQDEKTVEYENNLNNLVKINSDSFSKLLNKIEICRITGDKQKTKSDLEKLKDTIIEEIDRAYIYYANNYLADIFDDYTLHVNFILKIKILNHINVLLDVIDIEDNFCSQIKILQSITDNRKYNLQYNFELLFETISGYELLDEQFDRYNNIITNYLSTLPDSGNFTYTKSPKEYNGEYNILKYQQTGGANNYPLHHFMMGKGKSSTLTPLLALYFILIHNKNMYSILPEHLVKDSQSFINQYMYISDCEDNMNVCSDSFIKYQFLENKFNNIKSNKNTIFIIDEFDSLLDPLKSNYNIVEKRDKSIIDLFKFIYSNFKTLKQNQYITISDNHYGINQIILEDVNHIIKSIESRELIENINWGIDKNKCYAIPYIKKDKPTINSNFSSIIITISLTLYYYIILNDYKVSESIITFIVKNGIYEKIFKIHKPDKDIYDVSIRMITSDSSGNIKQQLFDVFFETIFSRIMIPSNQKNTSFVDIINIDNIYKIGYSGTVNLMLPPFPREDNKFNNIQVDNDEIINVSYALNSSQIFPINKDDELGLGQIFSLLKTHNTKIDDYDALIDQFGIFKNTINTDIAMALYKYFELNTIIRDVVYISEDDDKFVIRNGKETKYNSSTKYFSPFIYYSQAHTVGVDIKQDYYPTMKGLITIGPNSLYTNVAQAIFRLRKINLGHSIDIIYIKQNSQTTVPTTGFEVLEQLKCHEQKQMFNKEDLLIFQTLKSEIRKKRRNPNYWEPVKHYFQYDEPPKKIEEYYSDIFSDKELKYAELSGLFNKINYTDKLNKLIFNFDNSSITTEISTNVETETESLVNTNIEHTKAINDLKKILNGFKITYDYVKYDFSKINEIEIFKNLTIKLNDYIHFVPNIYYKTNGSNFKNNNTGYAFVFIDELDKLLLIPGYMVCYFYEKYIILDTKFLYLLNNNMIDKYQALIDKITCFKNKQFSTFIDTADNPPKLEVNIENFITVLILTMYNFLLPNHFKLIKFFMDNANSLAASKTNAVAKGKATPKVNMNFDDMVKKYLSEWINIKNKNDIIIDKDKRSLFTKLDDIKLSLYGIVPKTVQSNKPKLDPSENSQKPEFDYNNFGGGGQSSINKVKKYTIAYDIYI
jgi:hypothetical protein